jgi:acyl-CoA reductase-like NAD-dependent aldehyde dehydrogenase
MEAGLPEGVLNVVHGFGPDAAGQWLTESPEIDRITFTGESGTGRAIARTAAGNLVPVSLELGGKGANLVFADADLHAAVPWSLRAIFSNTGGGWFVRPTIAVDLPASARACREEIFGPVVTVTPFDGEGEGVKLANDTPYGLNAMLFTESLRRAHRVSAALKAGTVWVNCFFIRDLRAPFGGVGDSGWGREGGDHSREFCTEPKAVVMDI